MQTQTHVCPHCNTVNSAYALCCEKCAALLFNPRHTTRMMRIDPTLLRLRRASENPTTAPLERVEHKVNLVIRGVVERISFEEGTELVLGRSDMSRSSEDCFDLTAYGAHERGVSRTHAVLRFNDGELKLTDLGSVNGTSLNARRLQPNEAVTVQDQDDMMLGRLGLRVRFVAAGETDKFLSLNNKVNVTNPITPAPVASSTAGMKPPDTKPVPTLQDSKRDVKTSNV